MINDLDNSQNTINHLSLCLGYEGIGIGLRRVFSNLREIAYVERKDMPTRSGKENGKRSRLQRLSTRMLKPSHTEDFLDKWVSSQADFHANHLSDAGERQSTADPRHFVPLHPEGIKQ